MRRTWGLPAAAMIVMALTGCGGDDGGDDPSGDGSSSSAAAGEVSEAYCAAYDKVRTAQETMRSEEDIDVLLPLLEDAAAEAPAELADDWEKVNAAYSDFMDAIMAELLDPQDPPAGMTEDEATNKNFELLVGLLTENIEPVQPSAARIQKHGVKACPA